MRKIRIIQSPVDPTTGGALKASKREAPGSIPGRACIASLSEFFVVLSETRVNTG